MRLASLRRRSEVNRRQTRASYDSAPKFVEDNDRFSKRAEEIARRVRQRMLLSPEQHRQEHRVELARRIREQPEVMADEGLKRGALRYFLRCFREVEPRFLAELREILSEPLFLGSLQVVALRRLSDRYHLPPTAAVANECMKTLLMWQAFPDLPNVWHFERPEGALADPMRPAMTASTPYPFVFVAEGWNPETETLGAARTRLHQQFNAALRNQGTFWKSAEIDQTELRLFVDSPTLEKLRRNLKCLAEKQASGRLSYPQLAKSLDLTREAVRVGLSEAAAHIGLSQVRSAPPGAPKGQRCRK